MLYAYIILQVKISSNCPSARACDQNVTDRAKGYSDRHFQASTEAMTYWFIRSNTTTGKYTSTALHTLSTDTVAHSRCHSASYVRASSRSWRISVFLSLS